MRDPRDRTNNADPPDELDPDAQTQGGPDMNLLPGCVRAPRIAVAARVALAIALGCAGAAVAPPSARALVSAPGSGVGQTVAPPSTGNGSSLEAAATKAGDTGRKVAMSLIGLAFAIAAIVLSFRRDFKEAAGVFAVGLVAVLLATPAGVHLLRDTVSSLFGTQ
jgi:hypothetical protein